MLQVEEIYAYYGHLQVLHGVSLEVREGELVAVIGPNGAGKTTLLRSIVGLVRTKGKIFFEGEELNRVGTEKMVERGISIVPERRELFSLLTVGENLELGAYSILKRGEKEEFKRRLSQVEEIFPVLRERRKQKAETLSGGEQQMLAIGRALMSAPRLLLLDEPSLGLAPKVVREIFEVIKRLKERGMTLLLVEQDAKLALSLADRAYVMRSGEVVAEGEGKGLLENPLVREIYFGKSLEV